MDRAPEDSNRFLIHRKLEKFSKFDTFLPYVDGYSQCVPQSGLLCNIAGAVPWGDWGMCLPTSHQNQFSNLSKFGEKILGRG